MSWNLVHMTNIPRPHLLLKFQPKICKSPLTCTCPNFLCCQKTHADPLRVKKKARMVWPWGSIQIGVNVVVHRRVAAVVCFQKDRANQVRQANAGTQIHGKRGVQLNLPPWLPARFPTLFSSFRCFRTLLNITPKEDTPVSSGRGPALAHFGLQIS